MPNQSLHPSTPHPIKPPLRDGGTIRSGARACLFGGTIFAAGIVHADETFNFAVGPISGYATRGVVELGTAPYIDTYIKTGATAESALISVNGYHYCGSYSGYFSYFSRGSVSTVTREMTAYVGALFCEHTRASLSAYFLLGTSTEFRFEWDASTNYLSTIGIWSIPASGPPALVAGPGANTLAGSGSQEFVLGPGLYHADFVIATDFEQYLVDLDMLGDACVCDVDANGSLNLDDVEAFVTAFLAANLAADLDGNGTINLDDVGAFVACFLAMCP